MRNRFVPAAIPTVLCAGLIALATNASAQLHDPATPLAVASKVALRGEANSIAVREMRIVRKNDILVVQADMANMGRSDRTVFYRFRWLDSVGNQVGDDRFWQADRARVLAAKARTSALRWMVLVLMVLVSS